MVQNSFIKFIRLFHHQSFALYGIPNNCILAQPNNHTCIRMYVTLHLSTTVCWSLWLVLISTYVHYLNHAWSILNGLVQLKVQTATLRVIALLECYIRELISFLVGKAFRSPTLEIPLFTTKVAAWYSYAMISVPILMLWYVLTKFSGCNTYIVCPKIKRVSRKPSSVYPCPWWLSVVEKFESLYFMHCVLKAMYVDHNMECVLIKLLVYHVIYHFVANLSLLCQHNNYEHNRW